ncbi:MAG: hypothetical protein QME16_00480, partial [Planctomycetota bacterium]|nr:hypothetical protein [Planctomycetota bacterium]
MNKIINLIIALFIVISTTNYALAAVQITDLDNRASEYEYIRFGDNKLTAYLSSTTTTPADFAYNDISYISFLHHTPKLKEQTTCFKTTLVNQDILYGLISSDKEGAIVLNSNLLGSLTLRFEDILRIERVHRERVGRSITKSGGWGVKRV